MNKKIKEKRHKQTKIIWPAWLVFICLLGFTIFISYSIYNDANKRASTLFDAQHKEIVQTLKSNLRNYESVLRAGAGLLMASSEVTPDEWHLFMGRITKDLPGVLATGFIPAQPQPSLFYAPGNQTQYYDFVHSGDSEDILKRAAEATGPITFVASEKRLGKLEIATPSFLVILALRSPDGVIKGYVYGFLAIKSVLQNVLNTPSSTNIRVRLSEAQNKGLETLLYDSHSAIDEVVTPIRIFEEFEQQTSLAQTGHQISVKVTSLPAFGYYFAGARPFIILSLGFLLSVMAFIVTRMLFIMKEEAIAMARELAREVEEAKIWLEAIVDNTVDGLIAIDEKGLIQNYNKACEKIFGYAFDEVLGENIKILMPQKSAEEFDRFLSAGFTGVTGVGWEVEGRKKDGAIFPVEIAIAEIKFGNEKVFSGILRDITERKEYETQLKRTNEELEQFAYIASHDLKAPLRGIDNLARWIEEDLKDTLTEDTREKLDLMQNRVARLEALLEDILQYSRAGRIVDEPTDIDTGELVRQIIESIDLPQSFEVKIADDMPVLTAPYTPLHQIFLNLIANAHKHHDKDKGIINVNVRDAGQFYEFSVSDDGPGIPSEFQERVFKMFQTLQSRDKTEGSGLGMSIVKKLVEWQGGRAWIISEDGKRGTEIHFQWPKRFINRKKDAA